MTQLSRTYSCEPTTPGQARAWALASIRSALGAQAARMLLDDAALVVSELITNSLRAGCSRVTLCLSVEAEHVRVSVVDDVKGRPHLVAASPRDLHGRGLHIVSQLASDWGVTQAPQGKEVWADLALIPFRRI